MTDRAIVDDDPEDDGRDDDGTCPECGAAEDEECDLDCENYPPDGYADSDGRDEDDDDEQDFEDDDDDDDDDDDEED